MALKIDDAVQYGSTRIVEGEGKVAVDGLNAIVGLFVQDKMKARDSVS